MRGRGRNKRGDRRKRNEEKKSIIHSLSINLSPCRTFPVYSAALFPPNEGTMIGAMVDLAREKERGERREVEGGKEDDVEFFFFLRFFDNDNDLGFSLFSLFSLSFRTRKPFEAFFKPLS